MTCMPLQSSSPSCFSLFLAALAARPVHAQAIHEGKLTGTVVRRMAPAVPGATVDIAGPQLLGGQPIRGHVRRRHVRLFLNVPKGVYDVTTGLAGFKTSCGTTSRSVRRCHVHCQRGAAGGSGQ